MAQVKVTKEAKERALAFRSLVEFAEVRGRYEDFTVQVETAPGERVHFVLCMRSLDSGVIVAGEPRRGGRDVEDATEKAAIMVAAHDCVKRYVEERG